MSKSNKIFNESYFSGIETSDETGLEAEDIILLQDDSTFDYEIRVHYYTGYFGSYPDADAIPTLPDQFCALQDYVVSILPAMRFADGISKFVVEAGDIKDEVYPFKELTKAKFSYYGEHTLAASFKLKGKFKNVRQLYQFIYILLFPPMHKHKNSIYGCLFMIKDLKSPKHADFSSIILLEECIKKGRWLYNGEDIEKDISLEGLDEFMFMSGTIFPKTKNVYKQTMNVCGLGNYEMASIVKFQKQEYPSKDSQAMRVSANI